MSILYVGLDFEASGSDPWDKHVPIEIGMSILADVGLRNFEARIGSWNWNEWDWSEEAFGVHEITQGELENEMPVWMVDIIAAEWLLRFWRNRMFTVPVGWNVAGYDRQFITRWMPNLNRLLSYRSVDLNSLMFAASDNEEEYNGRKKDLKERTEAELSEVFGVNPVWHNALYDAQAALVSYNLFRRRYQGA